MKKARIPIIIILVIVIAAAGVWFTYSGNKTTTTGPLSASGTVETTEISIAPEIAGKILEVKVNEGDAVKQGDVLFTLDATLLQAQRNVAQTGRDAAQAALESAQSSATVAIQASSQQLLQAQQALKDLNENADQARAQAELALAQAQQAVTDRQHDRDLLNYSRGQNGNADAAWDAYYIAVDAYNKALDRFNKIQNFDITNPAHAAVQASLVSAQHAVDQKKNVLDWYLGAPSANDLAQADAKVTIAKATLANAQRNFDSLQNGPDPDALALAQANLQTAQAQYDASQAKTAVNQAAQAVKQADANIALIDAQLAKTTITAPVDSVVLNRPGEPGSIVNAGGTVLTLGRLSELTITVYVPEDRLGEVALGQTASVTVDSFPGETFTATVTFISDQAEFTPRNVQTVEGRQNTVFAVKLKLGDTSGKLKPGMPADVAFGTE
jgi:HlyD family secretion protein